MSDPAVLTAQAQTDLRAALRWIGPANLPAVRGLRDALERAAQLLGNHPSIGRLQIDLLPAPYRFWSLTRFQIVLVYNPATRPPRILRVLHTARDFGPLLAGLADQPDDDGPPGS